MSAFVPPGESSAAFGDQAETRAKLSRLREAIAAAALDAVYLEGVSNLAWLCGGRGNRVVVGSTTGACAVLVGANGAWLLVPNNEEARVRTEVFAELPLPVVVQPWFELPLWKAALRLLPANPSWAADIPIPGATDADTVVAPLRQVLGDGDARRYRGLGADAAEALETALVETRADWTELEVAGAVAAALKARDIEGAVVLVGCRARAARFRHLVPTGAVVQGGLVASITAVRHGLHASCTRSVSYGPVPADIAERHAAVRQVDRALLNASRAGATLGDAFSAGDRAYAAADYYDDWREHHQGGTTGYAGREVFGRPGSDFVITPGMALAWNPTVPGAKSEDTVLVTEGGLELLTASPHSPWPEDEGSLPRTGILEL